MLQRADIQAGAENGSTPATPERLALWSRVFTARIELRASIIAGTLLFAGFILDRLVETHIGAWMVWASLVIGMVFGLRPAIAALRRISINIDVLMVVAAAFAAGVGHPEEGALLLFLFVLSGSLEQLAVQRTRRDIEALHKLMPREARVFRDSRWRQCAPEDLEPGDRILIRPGDLVPADAELLEGETAMDQSSLTGESMPRPVAPGDALYAGAVNLDTPVEARVTRRASESSLQRVLDLVLEARRTREPVQRLIDRLSEPYAAGVMLMSLGILLIWSLVFGDAPAVAAYTAITFLIVASPCAIIIATPTVTLATIARGARAGVLFKGGQSIERLSRTRIACLDKTGTLTLGRPRVTGIEPLGNADPESLLALAVALEQGSSHPIAHAVIETASRQGVSPASVADVAHVRGRGVSGVHDGAPLRLGSIAHTREILPDDLAARLEGRMREAQGQGHIAVAIARGGVSPLAGVLIIEDPIRPTAPGLIRSLHAMHIAPVCMLTGDSSGTARAVAERIGVDEWRADLLPEDKVNAVHELRENAPPSHRYVAFVGDGVNDAPALAAADVGVAIGAVGTDAALESADVVLLGEDLATAPWAIALARRARAILRFNILLALGVIVVMGAATLIGSRVGLSVPMSIGVIAHEGGTLFVVANSLRLLWAGGVRRSEHAADHVRLPAVGAKSDSVNEPATAIVSPNR